MLDSTKIKFLGVAGTFMIISTAYALDAKTFYNDMYQVADEQKRVMQEHNPITEASKTEIKLVNIDMPKIDAKLIKPKIISTPVSKPKRTIVTNSEKLDKIFKEYKYLYVEKSGEISQHSKEILEKIIPLLSDINNSYIELEGHSASQAYNQLTQKTSEQYAQSIYRYLDDKKIGKEIIVTGHGDLYPILENKSDKQNSRVELKIRRR